MQNARLPWIAPAAAVSTAALMLAMAACGGASAQSAGASSPGSAASMGSDGGVAAAPTPPTAPSAPTTTTTTLGDAGDLQGTKLQSATSGSATADMPDAGPGRGPHVSEPGRGVKDIQVIVQGHRDDARACYDQAQQAHPDPTMKGNLDVKWTIDPTGKVTDIAVDDAHSDIHDPGVGKCVVAILKGIQFAVSAKGFETRAHYPFNFNPHNNPSRPRSGQ